MTAKAKDKKGETPTEEPKDDRPHCPYCNQKVDQEVLDGADVKTKVPIPRPKYKWLMAEQRTIDDIEVEIEKLRASISDMTDMFAEKHGLTYQLGLGIDMDQVRPGDKEDALRGTFFFNDGMRRIYLEEKALPSEIDQLMKVYWKIGEKNKALRQARIKRYETTLKVARDMEFPFRPPVEDNQGNLTTRSVVEQLIEQAEEHWKKKHGIA